MRVDVLALDRLPRSHVALHAAVARYRDGEVGVPIRMTARAEIDPLHGATPQAMLVVVTRRAQATSQRARGGITHEDTAGGRGRRECVTAQLHSGHPVVIEGPLLAAGEMPAGDGLLVLGQMTAPALAV